MCPNCGKTINLENRKKIDFNLIKRATQKEPRTFTELLYITKLSRKTLSLRLKELRERATLVKDAGKYRLNGDSEFENTTGNLVKGFSKAFHDRRIKTGLMLIALLIGFSTSGYVLARFFVSPPQPTNIDQGPIILGKFAVALGVVNVKDLYGWQAAIAFNSSELKVLETVPGKFVGVEYPFFFNVTDVSEGILLLGGTLYGNISGRDGSDTLATIVFGCFVDAYEEPRIIERAHFPALLDSHGSLIPIESTTELTLTTIEDYGT